MGQRYVSDTGSLLEEEGSAATACATALTILSSALRSKATHSPTATSTPSSAMFAGPANPSATILPSWSAIATATFVPPACVFRQRGGRRPDSRRRRGTVFPGALPALLCRCCWGEAARGGGRGKQLCPPQARVMSNPEPEQTAIENDSTACSHDTELHLSLTMHALLAAPPVHTGHPPLCYARR